MAAEFSRLLTLLRKEKGISQKSAAQQLGVSQALLSHYENGIRECGLDFLVRAADFYGVSCDYILGRTPDRNGLTLTIEELPESDAAGKENSFRNGVQCTLNKKLITNSLNIIFDLLNRSGSRALVTEVSDFLMLAVYRAFRVLHGANEKNQPAMFKLNRLIAHPYSAAMMQVCQANAEQIAAGKPAEGMDPITHPDALALSTESLSRDYPLFATSLLNLVTNAEKRVLAAPTGRGPPGCARRRLRRHSPWACLSVGSLRSPALWYPKRTSRCSLARSFRPLRVPPIFPFLG